MQKYINCRNIWIECNIFATIIGIFVSFFLCLLSIENKNKKQKGHETHPHYVAGIIGRHRKLSGARATVMIHPRHQPHRRHRAPKRPGTSLLELLYRSQPHSQPQPRRCPHCLLWQRTMLFVHQRDPQRCPDSSQWCEGWCQRE